eukprot:jgi/Bigna1/86827/estExt_fgenesh1_pg.C_140086
MPTPPPPPRLNKDQLEQVEERMNLLPWQLKICQCCGKRLQNGERCCLEEHARRDYDVKARPKLHCSMLCFYCGQEIEIGRDGKRPGYSVYGMTKHIGRSCGATEKIRDYCGQKINNKDIYKMLPWLKNRTRRIYCTKVDEILSESNYNGGTVADGEVERFTGDDDDDEEEKVREEDNGGVMEEESQEEEEEEWLFIPGEKAMNEIKSWTLSNEGWKLKTKETAPAVRVWQRDKAVGEEKLITATSSTTNATETGEEDAKTSMSMFCDNEDGKNDEDGGVNTKINAQDNFRKRGRSSSDNEQAIIDIFKVEQSKIEESRQLLMKEFCRNYSLSKISKKRKVVTSNFDLEDIVGSVAESTDDKPVELLTLLSPLSKEPSDFIIHEDQSHYTGSTTESPPSYSYNCDSFAPFDYFKDYFEDI